MYSSIGIRQHVLGESSIVFEPSHLPLLTESRISTRAGRSSHVMLASHALSTRVFEIQNANAVANFPIPLHLRANLYDLARRFMGRYHWQACRKLALQDLQVRMAEASSIDLHEEVILATSWLCRLTELVGLIELH
jgi:hypothetical protein